MGEICAYNIQAKPESENSQSHSCIEEDNLMAAKNTGLQMHLLHFFSACMVRYDVAYYGV